MYRPTRTPRRRTLALLALPLVFACTNGGGGGDEDNESDSPSQTEDRFAFVIPQSLEQDLAVSAGPLALQGELLDLNGTGLPDEVEWTVEQPGGSESGEADVNDDGSFSAALPLAAGDNQVRLTVEGADAESSFTVTLNPGYTFGGQLQVTPDVVYLNEAREITAAIALQDLETDPNSVDIVRIEGDGTETVLGMLADDGNLANGDEIEGDGIFTGRFFLTEAEAGQVDVRAVVQLLNTPEEARSESFRILATERLMQAELDEILNRQDTLQQRMDQAAMNGTLETEVEAILAELEQTAGVAQVGASDSGRGIYVVYESGISGVLYSAVDNQRSAPQARAQRRPGPNRRLPLPYDEGRNVEYAPYQHFYKQERQETYAPSANGLVQNQLLFASDDAEDPNRVRSARALGIGAQFWDWGSTEADQGLSILANQGCFETTLIQYTASGGGNVEDFKNLGSYGVILIATHGDSFYNGILSAYTDQFGWNIPFTGVVVLDSNMAVTAQNKVTYEDDLKKGRLVLWGNTYGIAPGFIQRYSGSLPNSLVWMGICRGAFNGTMAAAFLAQGAGAYLSFDEYVSVSWPVNLGVQTMQTLVMDDMDLSDAFTAGQLDPNYTSGNPFGAAEWKLYGNGELSLDLEGIQDGGFESNSIGQAWTVSGDGRVVPGLGASNPTEGDYVGIVSTGLGFTTDSGTISQRFCMPENATEISFDWNFFSEEFLEYVGSQFQDAFLVTLTEVDNPANTITLVDEVVDSLADQVSPVDNSFDQGDVYATGWISTTQAIPESLRGKRVELSFYATDVGDSIYDTAVLIDDIEIETENP